MERKRKISYLEIASLPNKRNTNKEFNHSRNKFSVSSSKKSYILNSNIPTLDLDFGERKEKSNDLSNSPKTDMIQSNKSYIIPINTLESLLVESINIEKQNSVSDIVTIESSDIISDKNNSIVSGCKDNELPDSAYIQKVHELYLTNRSKFVIQNENGYITVHKTLSNYYLQQHLLGNKTIGIFAGKELSKFICFDVDLKNESKKVTKELLRFLVDVLKYPRESILVSISGSKGFHVEIFFKTPKRVVDLYELYERTLTHLNRHKHEIEFRPNYNQAVKLPLSYNLKSNVFCDFVNDDLEILNTKKQELFNVVPANTIFLPKKIIISNTDTNSIPHILKNCSSSSNIIDSFSSSVKNTIAVSSISPISIDFDKHAKDILACGHLLYPNTRHKATIATLNYLVQNDIEKEDAVKIVKQVIEKTFLEYRHLINENTSLEFALKEVDRLSVYTVTSSKYNTEDWLPELTKEEIKFVLSTKKFSQKTVLLALFLHWTRLGQADVFYMTYNQINEYLGSFAKQRKLIFRDLLELQAQDLITIIKSNQKQKGTYIKKPNVYKINFEGKISKEFRDSINKLHIKNIEDLMKELPKLFKEVELKEFISKTQFYTKFKPYFK